MRRRSVKKLADLSTLPEHLAALQVLVNRCVDPACRKELIVTAACCGALDCDEGTLMISANQLETA